ncbi:hypothetical protein BDV26DRAFT_265446 [Aspergillus bertholletiae]|uniref:Uncharacterized protein n=1 Tax=Aspergillus bertholletiae TaxID=1226010 RepID=A0A5N7B392_9EURO|nr:hypothetical protein BDV26DRAFT_265446 [Aspergillus bertholletiae]
MHDCAPSTFLLIFVGSLVNDLVRKDIQPWKIVRCYTCFEAFHFLFFSFLLFSMLQDEEFSMSLSCNIVSF